jgi:hypothetical protein
MAILACVSLVQAQTWQALPFPSDSDWPGPFGSPAVISPNKISMTGQPVRTLESYSGPLTITFDTFLQTNLTANGSLNVLFGPSGTASNLTPLPSLWFEMDLPNGNGSGAFLQLEEWTSVHSRTSIWTSAFSFAVGATNHVSLTLSSGALTGFTVNNQSYTAPVSAVLPVSPFQIQMSSQQPTDPWTVLNFAVVPEPTTFTLAGVGLLGLLFVAKRPRS